MEVIAVAFQGVWKFLNEFKVVGIPMVYIVAGAIMLSAILWFIKGGNR